ncbi:MAG TPA: hypothetical protein VK393_07350 [Nocardioidaceae bacterium]|jgi:hypothetical protein|nr:hypothetical protein [Nocardioidaceae bacterium]
MTVSSSTGLDSFLNPSEIGAMYPFPDHEWLFVLIGVLLWLGWHALQIRGETSEEQEAVRAYEQIGLDRAMYHGATGLVATDEEWEEAQRTESDSWRRSGARLATMPRGAHTEPAPSPGQPTQE